MKQACGNWGFDNAKLNNILNDAEEPHQRVTNEEPSEEVSKFYEILEDMNEKLYPGSKHCILYFCVHLLHLKWMCGMAEKGLDFLIHFLKEFFPSASIPSSGRVTKKVIKDLRLSCPNDCMLYWDGKDNQQSCHVCGISHWSSTNAN